MFGIDMSVLIFGATIAGAFTLLGYFTSKFRKSGDSSSSSVYKVIGFVSNLFVFTSTVGLVFVFPMVWYGRHVTVPRNAHGQRQPEADDVFGKHVLGAVSIRFCMFI